MNNILSDNRLCYGCTACFSSCPVSAISMIENEEGFLEPEINQNLCIDCGLCRKVCPRLNPVLKKKARNVYAIKHKDSSIRADSQSGGAFWALCEYIIENRGLVYGCILDIAENKVKHIRVNNLEAAREMHGSKYVQSDLSKVFLDIKKDLINSRTVLFVGTPCQVAGLRAFLINEYENLITVDLLCHCVASPLIWREYVTRLKVIYKGKCKKAIFRDKQFGWGSHFETFQFSRDDKNIFIKEGTFARLYNSGMICRESCFSCQFKSKERVGDFTIGDCWGIERKHKEFWDRKGVSLFMENDSRVDAILSSVLNKMEYRSISLEDVLQPALLYPIVRNPKKKLFWDLYKKQGISGVLLSFGSIGLRMRHFLFREVDK